MARIEHIQAVEVLDSRGMPTVRASVHVEGGFVGVATVPSGASTGKHEAHELRDGNARKYRGHGVQKAVGNVNTQILAALLHKDAADQMRIDHVMIELDGTPNKSALGANAILAVSLATARAEALAQGLPLYLYLQQLFPKREAVMPIPKMNLINGGRHASNNMSIQEFHVVPLGASSFSDALRMGAEVSYALKDLLVTDGFQTEVGDEGGFAPALKDSDGAFSYLIHAIEQAGYTPGVDIWLSVDAAASEFFDSEQNIYELDGSPLTSVQLQKVYESWRTNYPIISIEDPFEQDLWDDWSNFVQHNRRAVQVVGDDLFVTNSKRIQEGIVRDAATAVLIKPNQVGTLTETLQAIELAQRAKLNPIISHRSGETEDAFIADLAVAVGAGQIKTGAPARSERCAKYNRLVEIEQELGGVTYSRCLQEFTNADMEHYVAASTVDVQRHL